MKGTRPVYRHSDCVCTWIDDAVFPESQCPVHGSTRYASDCREEYRRQGVADEYFLPKHRGLTRTTPAHPPLRQIFPIARMK